MGTDRNASDIPREVFALMTLLSNINAGAMIALCLWLGWAALQHEERQADARNMVMLQGCNCSLTEIPVESLPVVWAALDR